MKVSDYITEFLYAQDIKHIFEVAGGMITHLIDSIHCDGRIQLVSTHHEQAAAFAADAYARITGIPGVAMATSGPGAVNLLTGIGSCYFDSVPAIFITGQVNSYEQKGKRPIRQLGFQETDIVSMASPITKAALQINSPEKVPSILENAFNIALSGRPGPVLLDLPMDIQRANIKIDTPSRLKVISNNGSIEVDIVDEMLDKMYKAQRPLILVGGGIRSAQAIKLFRVFTHKAKMPVVNSLMAMDALPYSDPYRIGMIGSYGNRWANLAVGRSDFLLVIGSRLDIRQTGSNTESFKEGRDIYHVDCDTGEINNRIMGCCPIATDIKAFLEVVINKIEKNPFPSRQSWHKEIYELRKKWPDILELKGINGINPNRFMHKLSDVSKQSKNFVVDVGQHQMWAGQSLELTDEQHFLTSGGMGAMGYALPAAIGASFAYSNPPIIVIAGDGGFQLNIQELQTVVSNNLPIKIVVINNKCYGMVRQFQESYFGERYQSTYLGYSAPDYAKVANAYGIDSFTIKEESEVKNGLTKMWINDKSPFLLQVLIDTNTNVYPKMAFGRSFTEMEPHFKPIDMEGT